MFLWSTQRNSLGNGSVVHYAVSSTSGTTENQLSYTALTNYLQLFLSNKAVLLKENFTSLRIDYISCQTAVNEGFLQLLNSICCTYCKTGTLTNQVNTYNVTVVLTNNYVLRYVNQTTSQVTGVSGTKRGISQTLTSTMRGNEVIGYGQTFTEVCGNRNLDGLTGRTSHQTTHTCQLTHLLFITAGTGISHHTDWVEEIHVFHHGICNVISSLIPELNYLVITLLIGDKTAIHLLLDLIYTITSFLQHSRLLWRNLDIGNGYGHTCNTSIMIAKILYIIDNNCSLTATKVIKALSNQLA